MLPTHQLMLRHVPPLPLISFLPDIVVCQVVPSLCRPLLAWRGGGGSKVIKPSCFDKFQVELSTQDFPSKLTRPKASEALSVS